MTSCPHRNVHCLNGYELIRKYRCDDCGAVMMCACDEGIGRKHLSHQLSQGAELETQRRVPVTLGFVADVCDACRKQPITPYPRGAIHGQTTKLRRYYWREIYFEEMKRFDAWNETRGHPEDSAEAIDARTLIEAEVLAEMKHLHATAPKYIYTTETDADFIKTHAVQQIDLKASYRKDPEGKKAIIVGHDGPCTVEGFVSRHYAALGYETMRLESVPMHVLFGTLMWLVIQDPSDPLVRIVGFADRNAAEGAKPGQPIWSSLPEDFGTSGYGTRRAQAIEDHLSQIPPEREELQWLFDYSLRSSEHLRGYLWAFRGPDVERARRLLDILAPSDVINILRYLVQNYWHHYLGWPDLLIYRDDEYFLAEVKASGDKLSDEQKVWIASNQARLRLPFKLVKVHKLAPRQ
jgi:hypothetical protein